MLEKKTPTHIPMDQFTSVKGILVFEGYSVRELWEMAGRVPFYAYSHSVIEQKIELLRASLPTKIKLHYAIKANPMPAVVDFIAKKVDGLDLASLKELRVAVASGMKPEQISFAGPAKSESDLRGAVASGVVINIESPTELNRVSLIAEMLDKTARIAIRVNPDFELKASGMKMGGAPKQFGIDAEQVPEMLRSLDHPHLRYEGLHIFSGSQNLKPEAIIDAHNNTFALANRIRLDSGKNISKLNIGGGLGIPYFPGEKKLPLEEISKNLERLLIDYADLVENTEVVIELGRYLVGESGIYVCQITDRKISRDHTYLICDGGLHHHLSNSGNFGQVIRKNYPVTAQPFSRMEALSSEEIVTAVGPLCTPLDTLAEKMLLPKTNIGDFLVVFQSGAYGYTASPLNFLSHPHPVEIFL